MVVSAAAGTLLGLATALPLAWKWELGVRRVALAVAGLGVLAGALVTLLGAAVSLPALAEVVLVWALAVSAAVAILAYRFYRDPERRAPTEEGAIVSPADGEVIYVRRARDGVVPVSTKHGRDYTLEELVRTPLASGDAVVIGIAMSFLDVHVNRAPIAGRVAFQRHFPGLFGSLKNPEMMLRNERATTVIERDGLQVAVVQIASRLVRQIRSFVHESQELAVGERIGVIKLGSQVDLVIPALPGLEIRVQAGDRARAGESILARLAPAQATAAAVRDSEAA